MVNRDYEHEASILASKGIDTDKQLSDALDDNPLIDDYDIDFVDNAEARQILLVSGQKLVVIKAEADAWQLAAHGLHHLGQEIPQALCRHRADGSLRHQQW